MQTHANATRKSGQQKVLHTHVYAFEHLNLEIRPPKTKKYTSHFAHMHHILTPTQIPERKLQCCYPSLS